MAFDADVIQAIRKVAEEEGIEPAALLTVAEVESGGKAYTIVDGQKRPLILYEYHVFYRNLPEYLRKRALAANLARRRWGELPYKRTQRARYGQLSRARELHEQAAYAACSWGVGQVLGENAEWLGYASPKALAEEASSGVDGQVRVMLRFIEKAGLMDELSRRDWRGFARRYNGPGQVSRYARMMARAYVTHGGSAGTTPGTLLRIGTTGPEVADLQRALRGLGYHLVVDGDFGPATRRMVMAFQRDQGLVVDGIAGARTLGRIRALAGQDTELCF